MQKKTKLGLSFALAAVLVVGQIGFAEEDNNKDNGGMGNMMNGNGMTKMMENENMGNMMDAMNSPQGQKMMNACGDFMESYGDDEQEENNESAL
jgi:hypothetical protein